MPTNNKRIAKNTFILYTRQILFIFLGLYTSRIVLQNLGVEDYGIYGVVGGLVGFMSFLNTALATSSSRFLTFALGQGDLGKARLTFMSTFTIHVTLGLIVFVIGELIGPWMISTKLVIPENRVFAAQVAFQLSLLTTCLGISQVPYSATIVAHEQMGIYAYMTIWDVLARLIVALSLLWCSFDKLIFFASFLCLNSICVQLFYRFYCGYKFPEAVTKFYVDKKIFKEIANFSIWSFIQSLVNALASQGITIVIGLFFNPVVTAARSIAMRVSQMTTQFIGNFRQAMNPQIVKLYASGEFDEFRKLTLHSGLYSFYIMWIFCLPICLLSKPLLTLWLGTPPPQADIFCCIQLLSTLFWLFDASFQEGIVATGDIKYSTIHTCWISALQLPITYVMFKLGYDPVWAFILNCIFGAIIGCCLKPWLLIRFVGFRIRDFVYVYRKSLSVALISSIIPILVSVIISSNIIIHFLVVGFVSFSCCVVTIMYVGIDKKMRMKLFDFVSKKISVFKIKK